MYADLLDADLAAQFISLIALPRKENRKLSMSKMTLRILGRIIPATQ